MKKQQKFAIAGITGAMLIGAGTGVVLNLPSSAGASGVSIATPVTDPGSTTGASGTAATAGTADRQGPGDFLKTQLDALVAAGTITQAQEDAIIAGIQANRPAMGDQDGDHGGPGMGGPGMGHEGMGGPGMGGPGMGRGGHGFAKGLDAAAKALGITTDALTTELQGGKTIADVAADKSVDVQKVIDAIVAEETANISERVTNEVNGVRPTPPADAPAADTTPTTTG